MDPEIRLNTISQPVPGYNGVYAGVDEVTGEDLIGKAC